MRDLHLLRHPFPPTPSYPRPHQLGARWSRSSYLAPHQPGDCSTTSYPTPHQPGARWPRSSYSTTPVARPATSGDEVAPSQPSRPTSSSTSNPAIPPYGKAPTQRPPSSLIDIAPTVGLAPSSPPPGHLDGKSFKKWAQRALLFCSQSLPLSARARKKLLVGRQFFLCLIKTHFSF